MEEILKNIKLIMKFMKLIKLKTNLQTLYQQITQCITIQNIKDSIKVLK